MLSSVIDLEETNLATWDPFIAFDASSFFQEMWLLITVRDFLDASICIPVKYGFQAFREIFS